MPFHVKCRFMHSYYKWKVGQILLKTINSMDKHDIGNNPQSVLGGLLIEQGDTPLMSQTTLTLRLL